VLPALPDVVFASESYGDKLAEVLGARFLAVDPARAAVPISGTAIRANAMRHWEHLPRCVRPYFARRVSIVGPESTGKTTLARRLAERFRTAWVPEWARTVLERRGGSLDGLDWREIVRGQLASEDALARDANRLLICDTDPIVTPIWAEELLGTCPPPLAMDARTDGRYALTLLSDVDVPWVPDVVRYRPRSRPAFFARCEEELRRAGRRFLVLRGGWEERETHAARLLEAVIET
jgi:NadR type nicotinamide-nucleotide adenylyltransferase